MAYNHTDQELAEIENYFVTAKRIPTAYEMDKRFKGMKMSGKQYDLFIQRHDLLAKRSAYMRQEIEAYEEQMRLEALKNRVLVGNASKDLFINAFKVLKADIERGTALIAPKDLAIFAKLAVDSMDLEQSNVKINNSKNLIINLGKDIDSCSPEELDEIIYEVANAEIEQK